MLCAVWAQDALSISLSLSLSSENACDCVTVKEERRARFVSQLSRVTARSEPFGRFYMPLIP